MHKNNSFANNSKTNIEPLDPKSYSGINNISSESEPNIHSEINKISISNKSNIPNGGSNISSKFESESDIFPKSYMQQHKNDLIQLKSIEKNKILFSEKFNLDAYEGKNNGSESKLNNIEQINKKNDSLISSEKIGKNMNNLINDLSSKNIDMSNYFNPNNVISIKSGKNEILNSEEEKKYNFIGKKREFSAENNKNKFSIFTPPEKKNELRRFINQLDIEENQKIDGRERIKYCIDVLLKKIKIKFLKQLKKKANEILRSAGCEQTFKYLPLSFVYNIQKKINKKILNVTFKNSLLMNVEEFMENKIANGLDILNYEHNKQVLKLLEIKNLQFDFLNKTYIELFKEYLESKEFVDDIRKLKEHGNEDYYIKTYIDKAKIFINYYLK